MNLLEDAVGKAVDNSVQILPPHLLLGPHAAVDDPPSGRAAPVEESLNEGQSFFRQVASASTLSAIVVSQNDTENVVEQAGEELKKTGTKKETKKRKTKKAESNETETKTKKTETKTKTKKKTDKGH